MNALAELVPSLRDKVSPEEWAVRVDLAACYRLVAHHGWEDLVFTHITARVPGAEDQFLINPYTWKRPARSRCARKRAGEN